jgi:prophage antirepressor-like protein
MQVVPHSRFGNLHCIVVNGEPWFCAKDLAAALAYKKPRNAVADHVDEKHRCTYKALQQLLQKGPMAGPSLEMHPHPVFVSEAGMYPLVLGSKLEAAKAFKDWVCEDALPSIRKHGRYICPHVEVHNELQLHNAISEHLHKHHPGVRVSPGLGEYQVIKLKTTEPATLVDPYNQLNGVKIEKKEFGGNRSHRFTEGMCVQGLPRRPAGSNHPPAFGQLLWLGVGAQDAQRRRRCDPKATEVAQGLTLGWMSSASLRQPGGCHWVH